MIRVSFQKKETAGEQSSKCSQNRENRKIAVKGRKQHKTAPNLPKAVFPFPKLNKIFILFSLMYIF